MMQIVEFFSGTGTISKYFREAGHEALTIDSNPELHPDMVADISTLFTGMLPVRFQNPDVVWASPPCNCFSVIRNYAYFYKGKPRNQKTRDAISLVLRTLWLIDNLKPKYFFIENPRGMLRMMPFMKHVGRRRTVTYCQYGEKYQKPTDIWTNCYQWRTRKPCKANYPCHVAAPRQQNAWKITGTLALKNAEVRAKIPDELAKEIVEACEGKERMTRWF